jgi:hypothetical protein
VELTSLTSNTEVHNSNKYYTMARCFDTSTPLPYSLQYFTLTSNTEVHNSNKYYTMARCFDTSTPLPYSLQYFNTFIGKDSSIGIATDYGLDGRGSIHSKKIIFLFSTAFYRLWGPPSLLSNRYQDLFPMGQSGRGMKLTTHHHLLQRSRMVEV